MYYFIFYLNEEKLTNKCFVNHVLGNLNVIEKGWKEGEHYEKVEQTILCHDGESVQGSHLTTKRGTYVLQWYWSPDSLIISSGHHTKAKIMYYYEMLKSADYR